MERLIKQNVIGKFYLENVRKVSIRVQMFLTQQFPASSSAWSSEWSSVLSLAGQSAVTLDLKLQF